ncbi:MAG TPA: leucine-rich repeat protein [Verrucomicrobiae bacterium]
MKTLIPNLFLALAWLALPTLVSAQFSFTTNNGAITITGYNTAAGLNMVIPAATNGFPVTGIGNLAFQFKSITNVTIPNSVTSIGNDAFAFCTSLKSAYFQGNAPPDNGDAFVDDPATVYYLSGTIGWGPTFGNVSAVLWNPQANTLGVTGGHFGFNLTGPTNATIVVEACTNLSHPVWLPVATNTFSGIGTSAFSDLQSGTHPTRFYRERSP